MLPFMANSLSLVQNFDADLDVTETGNALFRKQMREPF